MQKLKYIIAEIGIEFYLPFECKEEIKFSTFRWDGECDVSIEFKLIDAPLENKGVLVYSSDIHAYRKESLYCIEHFVSKYEKPYAWLVWNENNPDKMICYILEEEVDQCRNVGHLFQLIRLEQILMSQNAMVLHSSFISWQNKGILFTGPSGMGKSTQADLWIKHEGAEIINGDRAVLRKQDGEWKASGLPYAGSSLIFRNETKGIDAIVVLRQGEENEIERLRPGEAFKWIYSEVITRKWDEKFQIKLIDSISDLIIEVPVYILKCRPEKKAVELLKGRLKE